MVEVFLRRIQKHSIKREIEDKMIWSALRNGKFSVKDFYSFLTLRVVWNLWVLTRFGFFSWEASWGRILTLNCLKRGGVSLVNRCFICKREESINHFLLHCVTIEYL